MGLFYAGKKTHGRCELQSTKGVGETVVSPCRKELRTEGSQSGAFACSHPPSTMGLFLFGSERGQCFGHTYFSAEKLRDPGSVPALRPCESAPHFFTRLPHWVLEIKFSICKYQFAKNVTHIFKNCLQITNFKLKIRNHHDHDLSTHLLEIKFIFTNECNNSENACALNIFYACGSIVSP